MKTIMNTQFRAETLRQELLKERPQYRLDPSAFTLIERRVLAILYEAKEPVTLNWIYHCCATGEFVYFWETTRKKGNPEEIYRGILHKNKNSTIRAAHFANKEYGNEGLALPSYKTISRIVEDFASIDLIGVSDIGKRKKYFLPSDMRGQYTKLLLASRLGFKGNLIFKR